MKSIKVSTVVGQLLVVVTRRVIVDVHNVVSVLEVHNVFPCCGVLQILYCLLMIRNTKL